MKLRVVIRTMIAVLGALAAASSAAPAQTTPPNVMGTTVWVGPYGKYLNGPFATVRICRTGTDSCQRIHGLLLDTGSFGLRIFRQALTIKLDSETAAGGETIAECTPFGSFTAWGRIAVADVKMGGEPKILRLPIQVINPNWPPVPSLCKNLGTPLLKNPQQFGINGILGVGLLPDDNRFGAYFPCTSAGCGGRLGLSDEEAVQNPVAHLPVDNNGVILRFPAISFSGAPAVSGKLILGIDTQSNNQLPTTANVYEADATTLDIRTTYSGRTTSGFFDSGSNGLFFRSAIPPCGTTMFYCPAGLVSLKVQNTGVNLITGHATVYIANAITLLNTGNHAFNDLGAALGDYFDFGMPFFFGRKVYVGMSGGNPSPTGGAPYWAYMAVGQ